MATLNFDSITDQVRELLQREIEAGRLTPGTRIYEDVFAEKLGISKSPLRFALYQLKQDGMIRIEPRRGFYVAVPTPRQMMELLEMREVLEGTAARRAAKRADDKLVKRLLECFKAFDDGNINERRMEFAAADHKFHRRLAEASDSTELIKTLEVINLRLHMNRLRARLSRERDLVPMHREHLAIIEAIRAGDAQRAETLASAHVAGVPWHSVLHEEEDRTAAKEAGAGL
jgi:DNA-binding GntR family transcriptional regulator